MFAVIDGTGAYNDQEYAGNMARSFCCQIAAAVPDSQYFRGPGSDGSQCVSIANDVSIAIQNSGGGKVYLAGYSRGGAIAIQVAKLFSTHKPYPIPVEAMFLLDPVGYTMGIDFNGIPANVKAVYTLFRDLTIKKQDFFLPRWQTSDWREFLMSFVAKDEDRYAREWMGNCDVTPDNHKLTPTWKAARIMHASHGAAGGVPWVERPEDKEGCEHAAQVMNSWLIAEGFTKVNLRQRWFCRTSARDYPQPTPMYQPTYNFKKPGEM